MTNQTIESGRVGALDVFAARPNAPPSPPRPLFRHFEVVGNPPEHVRRDGIVAGTVVMLDCDIRESCPIRGERGEELFRLEPCDATPTAVYTPHSLYALVLAGIGTDANVERSDRWRAEGEKWAKEVMSSAPRDPFEEFTHSRAVFFGMVRKRLEDGFLLPVATSGEIIGGEACELHPRSLWSGQDSDRLAEAERARAEQEKAAAAATVAVEVEVARPRTVGELGASIVAVRRDRPAKVDLAPWHDAALLWSTTEEFFYGYRTPVGLPLHAYSSDTMRVLAASEVVPASVAARAEISASALAWARWMISKYSKGVDLGPINSAQWSDRGLADAKSDIAKNVATFLNAKRAFLWKHFIEVWVRGYLVYPPQVEHLLREAMHAEEIRRSPPLQVPVNAQGGFGVREVPTIDPSAPTQSDPLIIGYCIDSAKGGSVSAGCLLEPQPTLQSQASKPTKKDK